MKKRIAVFIMVFALMISIVSVGNVIAVENNSNFAGAEKAVLSAWDELEDSADILEFNISKNEFNDFCDYVHSRNTEYFYVSISGCSHNEIIEKVNFKYSIDKKDIPQKITEFNKKSDEILNLIPENVSDVEKLLILHDYIAGNTKYETKVYTTPNYDDDYIRTSYGCIVNKLAVCEGISEAFSYFCKKLGINSYLVTSEEMHHQWNVVELGGKHYHIDVTQDSIVYNLGDFGFYQPVGDITHNFFLKSDEQISDATLVGKNNVHYNWDAPYSAKDSVTYKNAFWNNVNGLINYKNGKYYFVKDFDFVQYDFSNQTTKTLYNIPNTSWKCTYGIKHTYKGSSSKAVVDVNKDYVYFIVCNSIYSYNLNNGEISVAYTRYGKGFIYSILYSNGKLKLSIRDDKKNNSNKESGYYDELSVSPTLPDDDALIGDVDSNGEVKIHDVLCLMNYNLNILKEINSKNADVNLDSKVDLKDMLLLRRIIANKQG